MKKNCLAKIAVLEPATSIRCTIAPLAAVGCDKTIT